MSDIKVFKKVCKYLARGYICSKTQKDCVYRFKNWKKCNIGMELIKYTKDQQKRDNELFIVDHSWSAMPMPIICPEDIQPRGGTE